MEKVLSFSRLSILHTHMHLILNNPMTQCCLLFPYYRWENWGWEKPCQASWRSQALGWALTAHWLSLERQLHILSPLDPHQSPYFLPFISEWSTTVLYAHKASILLGPSGPVHSGYPRLVYNDLSAVGSMIEGSASHSSVGEPSLQPSRLVCVWLCHNSSGTRASPEQLRHL